MFRNRTSKRIALMAGSCLVVFAIAVGAWLFGAGFTSTVDAHALLQEAAKKNTVIKTYQAVATMSHTAQSPEDPAEYFGEATTFVVEGQGAYVVTSSTGGTAEYLLFEDKQYERESSDDEWEEMHGSGAGYEIPSLDSAKHAALIETLDDLEVVGDEMFNGVLTQKLVGKYDLTLRAEAIWGDYDDLDADMKEGIDPHRNQMLAGTERFVGWVGKEDGLLYGYTIYGTYPAHGDLLAFTDQKSVTFSNFNGDITIPSIDDGGGDDSSG